MSDRLTYMLWQQREQQLPQQLEQQRVVQERLSEQRREREQESQLEEKPSGSTAPDAPEQFAASHQPGAAESSDAEQVLINR